MSDEKPIDDVLDDLVEVWHTLPIPHAPSIEHFLGMGPEAYAVWVSTPSKLSSWHHPYLRWLHAQLIPAHEIECPNCSTTVRARMADKGEITRIRELESQVADLQTKLTAARRQHRSDVVAQQEAQHGRWAI